MSDDHWKKNISSSSGGGYRPLYDDVEVNKPTEREETLRERAERQRRERRAELTYTEKDYARWERNRKRVLLDDGVFLWTETKGAGHTFVSIHQKGQVTIFTYGRYDDVAYVPIVGEGVLAKLESGYELNYIQKELYRMEAKVFKILDVAPILVFEYFNDLWKGSDEKPDSERSSDEMKRFGKVIDTYDLSGNNCTTHSVNAIHKSGSKVFDVKLFEKMSSNIKSIASKYGNVELIENFITELEDLGYSEDFMIPESLERYLIKSSRSFDMKVLNVTNDIKMRYPKQPNINLLEKAGVLNESVGSMGSSSGYMGESSSGYSGGTSKGSLGGSYEL